jgi:tripartite-type tricarboxylate transporter receptor subunit TctC
MRDPSGDPTMQWTFRLLTALLAVICTLAPLPASAADPYPAQPVKLVVSWPAGGGVDVFARALAVKLGERWKKEVIVDNKPGASGIVGASAVANARPDGYTLLLSTDQELLSNQFLFSKLPYSPTKSFIPVVRTMEAPMVIVVKADSPYQNVKELVDAAKKSPGKINYGSNGPGTHVHVAFNWFALKAGAQFAHIPYKGAAPAIQAVLGGEIDMTAVGLSAAEPFLKSNMLRAIAITSPSRIKAIPTVPTLTEFGYDVNVQFLTALVAPAGTPPDVVAKIARDVKQILADPAFVQHDIERFGSVAIGDTPNEFANYLVKASPLYAERIGATNVKLD